MSTHLAIPTPTKEHHKSFHGHKNNTVIIIQKTDTMYAPATATSEKIPTDTWGPFTLCVVIFLVISTCLILNCTRIRRKVDEHRTRRQNHNDPESNLYPPITLTDEKHYYSPDTSAHNSSNSSIDPPLSQVTIIEPARTLNKITYL